MVAMESEVLGASLGNSVSYLPAAVTEDSQSAVLTDMGTDTLRLGGVQVGDIESELCSFLPVALWRDPQLL